MEIEEQNGNPSPSEPDAPPSRTPGIPPDAPQSVKDAANGVAIDDRGEKDALDFLLGPTHRPAALVPVELDTPTGKQKLLFKLRALDGARLQELDGENRKGDGPFAKLDQEAYNAAVVAEATEWIGNEAGTKKTAPDSEAFIGGMPGGAIMAMRLRFKYQPGLLEGLSSRVQDLSAFTADRVGSAQRALVEAAGNS